MTTVRTDSRTGRTGIPPTPRTWVPRPALHQLLERATERAVTIVVAPAGAGKTSTVAAWCAERGDLEVTWVSTGAGMQCERFVELCTGPGTVVIDDAHLMPAVCYRVLDDLLERQPEVVALVLLCRWDPPMHRLGHELWGRLSTIRGDAFRLDDDEARALIAAHSERLPADVVDEIMERTRGWAALVVLAAHTVAAARDPRSAVRRLADHGMGPADLLATQVFGALPTHTRHLLLCLAEEGAVTGAEAVRLTGDVRAADLLAELANAGLLVSRIDHADGTPSSFLPHPLLAEVTCRRLRAGGVAVSQAKSMLRRAGRSDVAAGDVTTGFRRLVNAEAWEDAVSVLAEQGDRLLLQVPSAWLLAVVRAVPALVEADPRACITLALDRWLNADVPTAATWIDRLLGDGPVGVGVPEPQAALIHLLRARMGGEPSAEAVDRARAAVTEVGLDATPAPLSGWLLIELAVAEAWAGDLAEAEQHLCRAAAVAEPVSRRLHAGALSQLAQVTYLRGQPLNAAALAERATAILHAGAVDPGDVVGTVLARAAVVQALASTTARTVSEPVGDAMWRDLPAALRDPLSVALHVLLVARQLQAAGAWEEARSWLETQWASPLPSPQLHVLLLVERCTVAAGVGDPQLSTLAGELRKLGAPAEGAIAEAALADRRGDLAEAARLLAPAAAGTLAAATADGTSTALVYRARILDALGRHDEADRLLQEALERTAAQQQDRPFRHPSAHGTPVRVLIGRARARTVQGWIPRLLECLAGPAERHVDVHPSGTGSHTSMGPVPVQVPRLTVREREVLGELARGSTYADVAQTLYVTENTVKTHVSALYSKLGAARRSDALRTARTLGLV